MSEALVKNGVRGAIAAGGALWIGLCAAGASAQQATGPAFDCAKAESGTEKLICGDAGLADLDRKLDAVYREALAKARDDMPKLLRTEQRGWIKGRDECWKAQEASPVFLTASWQAVSQRDCVAGQYAIRISELQATYQLVSSEGPVFYACEGNPANEVVATFFETDPKTARLERGDRTAIAWLVPAGSGAQYEGRNVELWTKGSGARVTWLDEELSCEVKPAP